MRALAAALGTSPATVNSAYRTLRARGLVVAAGRRGTRVARRPAVTPQAPPRRAPLPDGLRDLTIGLADPALLPPLGPALAAVAAQPAEGEPSEAGEAELVGYARAWFARDGIPAEAVGVTSGALDGVERLLAARLRTGDRVLVEDPAYPPFRDLLLALGLIETPVAVDERGLLPDALAAALAAEKPAAVVLVPRAQNPTGAAFDVERAAAVRAVLADDPDLLVIEDDHVSLVSGAPFHSAIDPDRRHWAVVRSVSKILHPDLRVALVAGDESTIGRLTGRQALGPRHVSHLLQRTAAAMLTDPGFDAVCARAQAAYAARRDALVDALAGHGIPARSAAGLNVWVPVREEARAVRGLGEAGWLVLAGERFRANAGPAIRITIADLGGGEAEAVAAALGATAVAGPHRAGY